MMSQSEALYRLQQIDLKILHHNKRLNEIDSILNDDNDLLQAQSKVDNAQADLKPLNAQYRDLELQIQATVRKSKSTEDRLYSGNVKNPKELQDMQNEITALKTRKSEQEDDLLEIMVEVEAAEETLSECEAQLQTVMDNRKVEHSDLIDERGNLNAEIKVFNKKREQALEQVESDNVQLYERMRPKKGNQPIAVLRDHACSACGIGMTRSVEQEVQRANSLTRCHNCERILVDVRV